jgi:hypothetical protein
MSVDPGQVQGLVEQADQTAAGINNLASWAQDHGATDFAGDDPAWGARIQANLDPTVSSQLATAAYNIQQWADQIHASVAAAQVTNANNTEMQA